jgi:hypothetical protein
MEVLIMLRKAFMVQFKHPFLNEYQTIGALDSAIYTDLKTLTGSKNRARRDIRYKKYKEFKVFRVYLYDNSKDKLVYQGK